MNIRVISGNHLTQTHVKAWSQLQQADTSLCSPYMRPEYTQAVAAVRSDVEVAVLEQKGQPVGFLPYQRVRAGVAEPVGGTLSDFHGIVLQHGINVDTSELMWTCNLCVWKFNHLLADQRLFQPQHWVRLPSPYIDLSQGYETYRRERREAGSRQIMQLERKSRKLQRERGEVRLAPSITDPVVLDLLIRWKRQQCRDTGVTDAFADPWTNAFLHRTLAHPSREFSGTLAGLYAGDRPLALLFGLKSRGVLHCLVQAYNPHTPQQSPGLLLMLELCRAAESLGIQRIDLGKGPEHYKTQLMTGATDVAEGVVDLRPMSRYIRRRWFDFRQWVLDSPCYLPARTVARCGAAVAPPLRRWLGMR
jgi:CelD/BcsL family acetyltransferase involved in cellulose biosynthesis